VERDAVVERRNHSVIIIFTPEFVINFFHCFRHFLSPGPEVIATSFTYINMAVTLLKIPTLSRDDVRISCAGLSETLQQRS
jgi:hypothetical protein